ncbi:uncharacterized protein LOC110453955 [Mizuhopecten yessoensis]|uniref:Uncharacterized protein n=1 Tax=Mizuhopecten yessoensis TaxID=6573 RepID=A0A210QG76_MIZYE|nr:uncharacterized protein LOC110453955 [Mizuhopecten yessoensis]OWF47745.1 hypothetical protein KP79_PYT17593 [Mizuhopecten yessoensis]
MFHLVCLVVLATLSGNVFGCDVNALNQCIASAAPSDPNAGPCVSFKAMMQCIAMYSDTCSSEIQPYTTNLAPLKDMCGGGGGQDGGCDMQALSACTSSMQSLGAIVGGDTQPSSEELKQVCSGYAEFQSCIATLPPACAEVLKTNNMQTDQMGAMVDQYCGGDGCDLMGIQNCMQGVSMDLKFDGESALSSIVQVSSQCGALEGVLTCLESKFEGCKNNDLVKNMTGHMDQMKMMVNFVCKEKKEVIMELAGCASKPVALRKLSDCEAKHPMTSDTSMQSKAQLCSEVNTMSECLRMATSNVCTEKETTSLIDLMKDAMKMFLKGQDPCDVSGAGMLMSSVWTSLVLVVAAIFL